jgi:serine/threonine-protein kinase
MLRIPPGGGTPEELATLSKGELAFGFPQLLPGGKSVLFTTYRSLEADGATIEVLTLKDRHRNKVLSGGIGARFLADRSPGGRLIYSNRANLFAVPFDLGKLAIAGTPVPLLDDIAYQTLPEIGIFTVSASGALIYRSSAGPISDMRTIQWLSPGGDSRAPAHPMEPLRTKQGAYVEDALSPDGQQIALSVAQRGGQDIWVYDLRQSVMKRLTHGGGFYQNPVWTPDGQYIMFSAIGQGILQIRADDPDQMHVLIQNQAITVPWCLTKDSSYLAYFISDGQKGQIWTVPLQRQDGWLKAGNPELFLNDHANDLDPSFSPDRHWIAYHSDQSGRREVYVRPFPRSSDQKWRISVSGGLRAHWSGNGHDLLYQLDDKIMAASYRSSDGNFNADTPRVWAPLQSGTWWDLSPDGSRALVLIPVETTAPKPEHEAVLLMNFSDELQRKVPLPK